MDFDDSQVTAAPQFSAVPCRYLGLYKIYFIKGACCPASCSREQLSGGSSTLSSPHRVSKCSSSAQNPNYFIEHLAVLATCGSQNLPHLTKVELKCGEPKLEENYNVGLWGCGWPWQIQSPGGLSLLSVSVPEKVSTQVWYKEWVEPMCLDLSAFKQCLLPWSSLHVTSAMQDLLPSCCRNVLQFHAQCMSCGSSKRVMQLPWC